MEYKLIVLSGLATTKCRLNYQQDIIKSTHAVVSTLNTTTSLDEPDMVTMYSILKIHKLMVMDMAHMLLVINICILH